MLDRLNTQTLKSDQPFPSTKKENDLSKSAAVPGKKTYCCI